MKPTPKQELEQLVNEQEEAAKAEIIAAQEAEQLPWSYRNNPTLVSTLDVPRDVKGLVELLEERNVLVKELEETEKKVYDFGRGGIITGVLIGAAPGLALSLYCARPAHTPAEIAGYFGGLILALGGMVLVSIRGNKIAKRAVKTTLRYKTFEQEKAEKIKNVHEQVEAIDQKLSNYEPKASHGDIVLTTQKPKADDPNINPINNPAVDLPGVYWLGQVGYVDGKWSLFHNFKDPVWGSEVTKRSDFESEKVIAVLRPREYLSLEDLKALSSSGSAILFERKERQDWSERSYGFVGAVNPGFLGDNNVCDIEVYSESTLQIKQGSLFMSKGETIYNAGEVLPKILVPEIKPRIL